MASSLDGQFPVNIPVDSKTGLSWALPCSLRRSAATEVCYLPAAVTHLTIGDCAVELDVLVTCVIGAYSVGWL